MDELELQEALDAFGEKIKKTKVYLNYLVQKKRVEKQPGLKRKIDEYRARNFEMQTTTDAEELYDKMDAFAEEYETFCADPLVDDFLKAELEFCRMMQKVYQSISERIEFD